MQTAPNPLHSLVFAPCIMRLRWSGGADKSAAHWNQQIGLFMAALSAKTLHCTPTRKKYTPPFVAVVSVKTVVPAWPSV
jgi:hypothetical protein